MFLGIDLGTSGVKVVLVDDDQRLVDQETSPLDVSRPAPLWSEQDPEHWWAATSTAIAALKQRRPAELGSTRGIGLSGQMHGATLLDSSDRVLRPAILWNDGRSGHECEELERDAPDVHRITGNLVMPGFTAPKLLWVRRHEPTVFTSLRRVLLPKDWLRLRMTGDYASDMSDSSGTLWLDVGTRSWSEAMLAACDLPLTAMPRLNEGTQATGRLRPEVADQWGLSRVPVAAGGGDNAAGAVGVGVIAPGDAFLSLGTSGVSFVASDRFQPNPEGAVHAFCHCLPATWHQMSVILSAASCLTWITRLVGGTDEATLLAEAEALDRPSAELLFLPYLSGERTPHNNPYAQGVFFGLSHATSRAELVRAVLEGVAFAFADGQDVLDAAGTRVASYDVIGGGSRSLFWGKIIASVLRRPLVYRSGGDVGPAYGAARLARICVTGEDPREVCARPVAAHHLQPSPDLEDHYQQLLPRWRALYRNLSENFSTHRASQ